MARPKTDFPPAEDIRALADGEGRLALRVTPGARSEGIAIAGGVLSVKVRAKPQDGGANDAVLALLANALGTAPSRLQLLPPSIVARRDFAREVDPVGLVPQIIQGAVRSVLLQGLVMQRKQRQSR